MKNQSVGTIIKKAFDKYLKDDPIRLSGTTAFFLVIALAPIVIMFITIFGTLVSESRVEDKLLMQAEVIMGNQGRAYIQTLVDNYSKMESKSILNSIVWILIFLGISTTLFSVIQNAINYIWRVRSKPDNNLAKALQDRLISFGLILIIGLIMAITLLLDSGISILDDYLSSEYPDATVVLIKILNVVLSFGISTLIFAIIYKFLPDAKIRWQVTWAGALITSSLFTAGKYLISFILSNSGLSDLYGAAGSIVIVLFWLFYSSIIFYFGAEITYQYALQYAKDILPKEHAVKIEIKEVATP